MYIVQQIRHRLYGQGNTPGITSRLTALLMWMAQDQALQVAHSGVGGPAIFLADLGEGDSEGGGGSKGRRKTKRQPELSNFQVHPALEIDNSH